MARVKGTLINAWMSFLKDRYGEEEVARSIQSLQPSDRSYLQAPILESSWYAMELQHAMSRLTKTLARPTDKDMAIDLGRYTAEYVHTKTYATILARDTNKQKPSNWLDDVLYEDVRRSETERVGPSSSVTRYRYNDGKPPSPGQCRTLVGFLIRQQELRGRRGITCTHPKCLVKGDDRCEFLLQWKS